MSKLNEYLNQIQARCDAATKGPWKYDCGNLEVERRTNRSHVCNIDFSSDKGFEAEVYPHYNGDFIAHARQDVEVLLEMVKLLKEGMEQVVNNSNSGWHTEKQYLDKLQKLLTKGDE